MVDKIPFALIRAMRPWQWIKNLLLFAGGLFSLAGKEYGLADIRYLFTMGLLGFFAYSFAASAIYLINDVVDAPQDRMHPRKKNRPIAAGIISPGFALSMAVVLILASALIGLTISLKFCIFLLIYFLLFVAYTFVLKKVLILDAMIIALGFVLRAIAGAVAVDVPISVWLVICTVFLALFLGFSKRRAEFAGLGSKAAEVRSSLRGYTVEYLDIILAICASMAVIFYSMYSLSDHARRAIGLDFIITLPFVVFGIFRYLFLVVKENRGEDPARELMSDLPLLITVLAWMAINVCLILLQPRLLEGVLVL